MIKQMFINVRKSVMSDLFILFTLLPLPAKAQGLPLQKNYAAQDYHAHNFNFDIDVNPDGTVFVANFEGLLYYDYAEWHTIYTPGYTRVTVVYRDEKDSIWAGGFNYIGKVRYRNNGVPYLHRIGKAGDFEGEVQEMTEHEGLLLFAVNDGKVYQADGEKVVVRKVFSQGRGNFGLFDVVDMDAMMEGRGGYLRRDTTQTVTLDSGLCAVVRKDRGLFITDSNMHELYTVSERNGLCSNAIVWADYDGRGCLWGATENGVFSLALPSAYSCFTSREGLKGEVLCMTEAGDKMYVGTSGGVYVLNGRGFARLEGISHACWALAATSQGLAAATATGVWLVTPRGLLRQLSGNSTTALLADGLQLYSGEMDGVWRTDLISGSREKVCPLKDVCKIISDSHGIIWLQSIHGEVVSDWKGGSKGAEIATIVELDGEVVKVDAESDKPFPYPRYAYTDPMGVAWLTNADGTGLYRWKNGRRLEDMAPWLYALRRMRVRSVLVRGQEVWIGGDRGLVVVNTAMRDPALEHEPQLMIRRVVMAGDSVLWGGFGRMPEELPRLGSNEQELRFTFSLDYLPIVGETLYRYRLDRGEWSGWTNDNDAKYLNLYYGRHTFEVQAIDPYGRETSTAAIRFSVAYPIYMRWYMVALYLLMGVLLVYALVRLRTKKLKRDKQRLEQMVEERTEEVRSAHRQLVKQEKLATVGKLTQGLIDRILNPLNYINNFTKLSEGLIGDIKANIEDEKEHISEDNYEDTIEVLGMVRSNLQKVGEHGQNTSRIVKAMEYILQDRTGGIVKTNLIELVRMIEKRWQKTGITPMLDCPDRPLFVMANPELLSKVLMSLLNNSAYAIEKRIEKLEAEGQASGYQPELTVRVTDDGQQATIIIRDTGIGIEEKILDKIFDPFFTTKTTGEASGIGLYLSHDIIQNYGGQITVESVKDDHTTFTITLPITPKE